MARLQSRRWARVVRGWMLVLLSGVLCLGCGAPYGPPYPLRPDWDNSELVPRVAPPPELLLPPPARNPLAGLFPPPEEWQAWKPAKMRTVCRARPGKAPRCRQVKPSVPQQALDGALVRATLNHTAGSNSARVKYRIERTSLVKIYEVVCAVKSPCTLLFPPGERLMAPPMLVTSGETEKSWTVGEVGIAGGRGERQQILGLWPHSVMDPVFVTLAFSSGQTIALKLVSVEDGGMMQVDFRLAEPEMLPPPPLEERPPTINVERLFAGYSVEVLRKIEPPWMPVSVIDDGSNTFIKFAEPLTYTRAPMAFGVNQRGGMTLVQSHMFIPPHPQPGAGAWLVVQGLHPALTLKDSAGLAVRLVRGNARAPTQQGASHDSPPPPRSRSRPLLPAVDRAPAPPPAPQRPPAGGAVVPASLRSADDQLPRW